MRALTLTLVACMLLAASVAAVDSQASARAVETRWKNCSQISRGRLGALHDADDNTVNAELSKLSWTNLTAGYSFIINFQPCIAPFVKITDVSPKVISTTKTFDQVYPAGGVQPITTFPTDTRLVTFTMPDTSDAVPMITISYRDSFDQITLDVTAKCDPSTTGNVTAFNNTLPNRWTLTVNTVEACARFPYTNQALPGGGVAALVVCILCFVFEFAACFVYHKNNKNHSPLDEESMR